MNKEEDTKCRIQRFAKKLFSRGSYESISIRDICQKAGTNVSAISYHFGGKKELYRQCLEEHGTECLGIVQRLLSETPQSMEECRLRLKIYTQEMFEHMIKEIDVVKMIFREIDTDLKLSEDIFKKFYIKSGDLFETFLTEAQKKGFLKKGIEPNTIVSMQVGFLLHEIQISYINKKVHQRDIMDKKYRDRLVEQYISILFDGAFATKNGHEERKSNE